MAVEETNKSELRLQRKRLVNLWRIKACPCLGDSVVVLCLGSNFIDFKLVYFVKSFGPMRTVLESRLSRTKDYPGFEPGGSRLIFNPKTYY